MLKIVPLVNGDYLISSVAVGIEEYYVGSGEAPGTWTGHWAHELGLAGEVDAGTLRQLIEGRDPASGEDMLAKQRPRTTKAFDLTISAPKSVSLLWALGTPHAAKAVMDSHTEAVDAALAVLEERTAVARKQSRKVRRRVPTEGFVVARFVHRTSREGDPQLHTHCLLPNIVQRAEDGTHVALDAGPIHDWAKAAGSIYQNELQRLLTDRLGVEWGPDRNNTRDIAGITKDQLRVFSKRSGQIEAELEKAGATYEGATKVEAADNASLATRRRKDRSLTPALLSDQWELEAAACGLPTGRDLHAAVADKDREAGPLEWEEIVAALVDDDTGMCGRDARFDHPAVVEKLCAFSGGRLSASEILAVADRFLASEHVVRLTPTLDEAEQSRTRVAAQWSTKRLRTLEDAALDLADTLAAQPAPPVPDAALETALAAESSLGADQAGAARMATGPGASLRLVTSPAGFGKTTTARTIAAAHAADGRRVLGVATTTKAVAELNAAGVPAMTIARLRIDLADARLAPGTVLLWDEASQTSTRDAHAVLAAVAASDGSMAVAIGDHLQTQPVGPGGIAHHLVVLARSGRIPGAELTENRRQHDPADQAALTELRAGRAAKSQAIRSAEGWEHEHATPTEARNALAAAAAADITGLGPAGVGVLTVSHGDAEDLADRIRARLAAAGAITGPHLTGPGWTIDRTYQAGDRILLHARHRRDPALINGATATVLEVAAEGMTVAVDNPGNADGPTVRTLPASWAAGTKPDGTPNLSHAWARTIDGAQGGTWEACHLLGTPALDAYRGYTGQSRSRQPTHTWNTTPIPDPTLDHGGRLAPRPSPEEQVAAALARRPDGRLAAASDPSILDRRLAGQIAAHQTVLAREPLDRTAALAEAERRLADAVVSESQARRRAERITNQVGQLPIGHRLTRAGRADHRRLEHELEEAAAAAHNAADRVTAAQDGVARLAAEQAEHDAFTAAEGWRRTEIDQLEHQLAAHWTEVVVTCVEADQPLAYGIGRLRAARAHTIAELDAVQASFPTDRHYPLVRAKRDADTAYRHRVEAEERRDAAQRAVDALPRRLPTRKARALHDNAEALLASTSRQLEDARSAHLAAADRLRAERKHQADRQKAIDDAGPVLADLREQLTLIDQALDDTRPDRTASQVQVPDPRITDLLGDPPSEDAARTRWLDLARTVERELDHGAETGPGSTLAWIHRNSRREIETGRPAHDDRHDRVAGILNPRRERGIEHEGPDLGLGMGM